jgi:hypothetical protein
MFDVENGEIPVKIYENISISEFWDKCRLILTNKRIIALPPSGGMASAHALERIDTYYKIVELEDIKEINLKKSILFGDKLILTFKDNRELQLKGASVSELREDIEKVCLIMKPLIILPEDEEVIYKSGYRYLPYLPEDFREKVFYNAKSINLIVTNKRLIFYHVLQVIGWESTYYTASVRYGRPTLLFISIPLENVEGVVERKSFLDYDSIVLKNPPIGVHWLSLKLPKIDEVQFVQESFNCEKCGSFFTGVLSDTYNLDCKFKGSHYRDDKVIKGFVCPFCKKILCKKCANVSWWDNIRCPFCGNKTNKMKITFINGIRYKVQPENYDKFLIHAEVLDKLKIPLCGDKAVAQQVQKVIESLKRR